MVAEVYNEKNEKTGAIELPERIFSAKWNPDLVHQILTAQAANSRKVLAHAKGRGEVRGGGKKPWRQKGTGRARHGSIRSPLWKGGGAAHGPKKEKIFAVKVNKKMKQLAIFSILSKKLKDSELKIVDFLALAEPKTSLAVKSLAEFFKAKKFSALLIPGEKNKNIYRASRNIAGVKSLNPKSLNAYDLLRYKNIVLDKGAVSIIDEHYHETK